MNNNLLEDLKKNYYLLLYLSLVQKEMNAEYSFVKSHHTNASRIYK